MRQSTKSVDYGWHPPSRFIAIYVRWEMVDFQSFADLEDSLAYLDRNQEYGDLYPICVFDMETNEISYRYHWPDGTDMTNEDLQPYIDHVKPLTFPRMHVLQQIKDAT